LAAPVVFVNENTLFIFINSIKFIYLISPGNLTKSSEKIDMIVINSYFKIKPLVKKINEI